jgi:hypothetical protein
LDEIDLARRHERAVRLESIQAWKLDVKNPAASLTYEDGNDNKAIPFTDFPEPGSCRTDRRLVCCGPVLRPSRHGRGKLAPHW